MLHTGSSLVANLLAALRRIRAATLPLLDGPGPNLLSELTAGGVGAVAARFEQTAELLAVLGPPPRVRVCLDACHAHAVGDRLALVHANESRDPPGSHRDARRPGGHRRAAQAVAWHGAVWQRSAQHGCARCIPARLLPEVSSTVVVMSVDAGPAQIQAVVQLVEGAGGAAFVSRGVERTIIGLVGDVERFASLPIADLAGVENVVRVSRSFKLVSRESHRTPSAVHIGPTTIGRDRFTLIAGPCAVEDADQALAAAWMARRAGAALLRGGAFKPRTSPYSFQGLGEQGLEILAECRRQTGLPLVTEVLDVAHAERVAAVADMLQIGTRNMANYTLLKEVGRAGKPVLLKRGMSATIEEWLMAAEYVAQEGNLQIVLCERGIRTFEPSVRNTLDLTAVLLAHDLSHLPVIVDPSHAAGRRDLVVALARGAAAIGADGVMVDVHPYPERARVDGPQALVESDLDGLAGDLRALATLTGRQWVEPPAVRAPAGAAPTG